MKMRTPALWITCLLASSAWAEPMLPISPEVAAPPEILLARHGELLAQRGRRGGGGGLNDSDLGDELTLDELIQIEYGEKKQSSGSAIGLSLLPGGGFGLMYADKKAQALVPILFSVVGYGVAGYYMLGMADTSSKNVCLHSRQGEVDFAECSYGSVPHDITKDRTDSHSPDPRAPIPGQAYYETIGDYSTAVLGEDFDGMKVGLTILASTYAATTILGAMWSASAVSSYNDRLLKDLQSTTQATPPQPTIKPMIAYDGDRGLFGVRLDF